MPRSYKRSSILLAALLATAGCGPSGNLSGKVAVVGGEPRGAVVTATGPVTRVSPVSDDGSYAFEQLPDGAYVVQARVASTLEEVLATHAEVSAGSGTAPELTFTGVGTVEGHVLAARSTLGIEVFIAGTAIQQRLGGDGDFRLERVPAGTRTLAASGPGFNPVAITVEVPFGGTTPSQMLPLTEGPNSSGLGTVRGHAYRFDRDDHSGITVELEGAELTATTSADGSYVLTQAPLGHFTLVFRASGYDPVRVDNVLSTSGGTFYPDDVRLFRAARRFAGQVTDFKVAPDGSAVIFTGRPEWDDDVFLYVLEPGADAPARALRRLGPGVSALLDVWWQADTRKAAVRVKDFPRQLLAVDVATATAEVATEKLVTAEVKLGGNRIYFLEATPTGPSMLATYDFATKSRRAIEPVERSPNYGFCYADDWAERADSFHVSRDGQAAYHTPQSPGPREVHRFDGATVQKASDALDCVQYRAGGTVLLGFIRSSGNHRLYNLSGPSPVQLYDLPSVIDLGFSGDDAHAWVTLVEGTDRVLRAVPVQGGTLALLHSNPAAFTLQVQPGGSHFAVHNPSSGVVRAVSASGMELKLINGSAGESAAFAFSPKGKRLWVLFTTSRELTVMETANYTGGKLGVLASTSPNDLAFSPRESVTLWRPAFTSSSPFVRLTPFGSSTSIDLSPTVGFAQVAFPLPETHALTMRPDSHLLHALAGGDPVDLERLTEPVDAAGRRFSGDGARLLFAEGAGGRVLAADMTGALTHVADRDGQLLVLGESARALIVDATAQGARPGLHVLTVP